MTGIDVSYSRSAFRTLTRLGETRRKEVTEALGTPPHSELRRALGQGFETCRLGSGLRLVLRQSAGAIHVLAVTGSLSGKDAR